MIRVDQTEGTMEFDVMTRATTWDTASHWALVE